MDNQTTSPLPFICFDWIIGGISPNSDRTIQDYLDAGLIQQAEEQAASVEEFEAALV